MEDRCGQVCSKPASIMAAERPAPHQTGKPGVRAGAREPRRAGSAAGRQVGRSCHTSAKLQVPDRKIRFGGTETWSSCDTRTAPRTGRRRLHVTPGLPSVHLHSAEQAARHPAAVRDALAARHLSARLCLHGTPPAAGRAWVPGCRARTLRPYFFLRRSCALVKPLR
jgi:hypothetical protein